MLNPDSAARGRAPIAASQALRVAALSGLLCAAAPGCMSSEGASSKGEEYVVLSTAVDPNMTLETFTSQCDARGGTVEMHSHCGGSNTCRGMSYDTGTQVLTEHTCRGMNTCAGYSCVVE